MMNNNPGRPALLACEYDFRTLRNLSAFTSKYIWPRKEIINRERAFYVDPGRVSPEHNPFRLSDAGLSIVAMPTPAELYEYAHGISKVDMQDYGDDLTDEERKKAFPMPLISGVLTTRDAGHSQLFGDWEMSAKLPSATGAWPAFWLLPTHDRWPDGVAVLSEIDIMEAVKDVVDGVYHASMHTNQTGALVSSKNNEIVTGADLVNEYHRYGLSWEPDWLVWFFDGVEVRRLPTPQDMQDVPRHMLINLAVGGWGGEPDIADYPASFDIEWVRVYQSAGEHEPQPVQDTVESDSDYLATLSDGRTVTRSDVNKVCELLIQLPEIIKTIRSEKQ